MVNEIVMYQSIFVLGILMFGFFSFTFNNYTDFAEDITIDNNLDRILQELGNIVLDITSTSQISFDGSNSVDISVEISIKSEFGSSAYFIDFEENIDGTADMVAYVDNIEESRFNLGLDYRNSPIDTGITFSGRLASSSISPSINYQYDGVDEFVTFVS